MLTTCHWCHACYMLCYKHLWDMAVECLFQLLTFFWRHWCRYFSDWQGERDHHSFTICWKDAGLFNYASFLFSWQLLNYSAWENQIFLKSSLLQLHSKVIASSVDVWRPHHPLKNSNPFNWETRSSFISILFLGEKKK